jgi:hypothetical protein
MFVTDASMGLLPTAGHARPMERPIAKPASVEAAQSHSLKGQFEGEAPQY